MDTISPTRITSCELALLQPELLLNLAPFDFAFLIASGRVTIKEPIEKADITGSRWWPEHVLAVNVLTKAWRKVSPKYIETLADVFPREWIVNEKALKKLYSLEKEIGNNLREEIDKKIDRIYHVMRTKAMGHWGKKLAELEVDRLPPILDTVEKADLPQDIALDQWLEERAADQLKLFAQNNPTRILHPEIERLVNIAQASERQRNITWDALQERLVRFSKQEQYWQNADSVQAGFLWHAEGIAVAHEYGVTSYQIVNPLDKKTCPICRRMHGTIYTVEQARDYVTKRAALTDLEDIKSQFPFPRLKDVDNISREQLQAKGYALPPYHGRCRDEIQYVGGRWEKRVDTTPSSPLPPPPKPSPTQLVGKLKGIKRKGEGLEFVNKPRFKTFSEAEKWIKLNLADDVDFAKASLDEVNATLQSLRTISENARMPRIPRLSFDLQTDRAAGMFTRFSDDWPDPRALIRIKANGQKVNTWTIKERLQTRLKQLTETIEDRNGALTSAVLREEKVNYINKLKKEAQTLRNIIKTGDVRKGANMPFGVSAFADTKQSGSLIHELGHAWHHEHSERISDYFKLGAKKMGSQIDEAVEAEFITRFKVSKYSNTNWKETIAENFTMYHLGEVRQMHPEIVHFMDEMFPTLQYGRRLQPELYGRVKKVVSLRPPKKITKLHKPLVGEPHELYEVALTPRENMFMKAVGEYQKKINKAMTSDEEWEDLAKYIFKDYYMGTKGGAYDVGYLKTLYSKIQKKTVGIDVTTPLSPHPEKAVISWVTQEGKTAKRVSTQLAGRYKELAEKKLSPAAIAEALNKEGYVTALDKPFSNFTVLSLENTIKKGKPLAPVKPITKVPPPKPTVKTPIKPPKKTPRPPRPPKPPKPKKATNPIDYSSNETWSKFDKELENKTLPGKFKEIHSGPKLGGQHKKHIFEHTEEGSQWMFKPSSSKTGLGATAEEAAYKISRQAHPSTTPVKAVTIDGRTGSIQRLHKDVYKSSLQDVELSSLTAQQLETIQREQVIDWMISNHDTHAGQWIMLRNGNLVPVDKGQAFKFFPNDRLDVFYNPNHNKGSLESVYSKMYWDFRAGKIKLDLQATLKTIEAFEQTPDAVLKEAVLKYAKDLNPKKAAAFVKKVIQRKNGLRREFERYYSNMTKTEFKFYGEPKFASPPKIPKPKKKPVKVPKEPPPKIKPEPKKVLEHKPDTIVTEISVSQDAKALEPILKEAEELGWQGKAIPFDKDDFEDQMLLTYKKDGKPPVTVFRGKVRPDSDSKIVDAIKAQNPEAVAKKAEVYSIRYDGSPIGKMTHSIQTAAKHVNAHLDDLEFDKAVLAEALNGIEALIHISKIPGVDQQMAEHYLKMTDGILQALGYLRGKEGPPRFPITGFHGYRPAIPITPSKALKGGSSFIASKSPQRVASSSIKKGRLVQTGKKEKVVKALSGDELVAEFADGTTIKYNPWDTGVYSTRGQIEISIAGEPTPEKLARAQEAIRSLKLNSSLPSKDDMEHLYLLKQAYATKEANNPAWSNLLNKLDSENAPTAKRVREMRGYWERKLGVPDLTRHKLYQPLGQYEGSNFDITKAGGRLRHYRFDFDDSKLGNVFYHQESGSGNTAKSVMRMLKTNGSLSSNTERMRLGRIPKGMSPSEDLKTGGGSYVFTRCTKGVSRGQGLYFKKRVGRRLDAIAYKDDRFGDVRGDMPFFHRATTPEEMRDFAFYGTNETIFKDSLSVIHDIDYIVVRNAEEKQAVIKAYKAKKIEILPDGRPVKDIVLTREDVAERKLHLTK